MESYEEAKEVLNRAISAIPLDHTIWISAAKLEEANGHAQKVYEVVKRAFKKLKRMGATITRDEWL
jgi:pre-mRNA-processing factor 6